MFEPLTQSLSLQKSEIHLWRFSVDEAFGFLDTLVQTLSGDELARAQRLQLERHRMRFIVTRGALRYLLGKYLNRSPESLIFSYGGHGKPKINDIEFNLSHTESIAIFAVAKDTLLGIDIEHHTRKLDEDPLAARFFSRLENETLMESAGLRKKQFFLQIWTRKEAYLKATGEGISRSLRHVDVTKSVCQLLDQTEYPLWSLYDIDVGQDYVSALCALGENHRLIYHHLNP